MVRKLENSAFKSGCFKQLPTACSSLFACVTHAKEARSAATDLEDQAGVVVIGELVVGCPKHVGGVEHANGCVAEIVVQTHVGVDDGCIGVSGLTQLVESCFACLATANRGDLIVCGQLIKEICNVNLVTVKRNKVVENAVVVAVTVRKDPSLNDVFFILGLGNIQFCKRFVEVVSAVIVVITAVNDHCVAVGKFEYVTHTDHRVVNSLASCNTDLYHSQGTAIGRGVLLQNRECIRVCLFDHNACLFVGRDPINGNELVVSCQKNGLKLCAFNHIDLELCKALVCKRTAKCINRCNVLDDRLLAIKGRLKLLRGVECFENFQCRKLFGRYNLTAFIGRCLLGRGCLGSGYLGCSDFGRGLLRSLGFAGGKHRQKHNNCQKQCKKSFHLDSFLSENFPIVRRVCLIIAPHPHFCQFFLLKNHRFFTVCSKKEKGEARACRVQNAECRVKDAL